jgi:hypothetical protein
MAGRVSEIAPVSGSDIIINQNDLTDHFFRAVYMPLSLESRTFI